MNKKTLFSIRKLSVGIASVAIGGLLFISSGYSAHAAEDDNPSNSVDNTIKDTSGSENQDSTNTAGNTENNNNEDNNTPANTASGEQDQNSGNVTENGNDSSKQDGDQDKEATKDDNGSSNGTAEDQDKDGTIVDNKDASKQDGDQDKEATKDDNGSSNGTAEDQDKDGTIVDNKDASKQDGDQDKEAPKEDNGSSEATNKESGNTVEGTTHKVAAGETIEEIAKEHNTTVNQIAKDNGISNPNLVVAGTDLVINQPSSSHVNNDKVTSESHNANSNELPETGEDSGINVGLTGGLALAAGAALVASRRRKEQE